METQEVGQYGISAKETNNSNSGNEEIIKSEQLGDSPFIWVGEEKGFVALGQYKLTEEIRKVEGLQRVQGEDWEFMIAVIGAITVQTIKTYKNEEL